MLLKSAKNSRFLTQKIARSIFGFFERKTPEYEEKPAEATQVTKYRQAVNQNKDRELTKAEQYYADLRKEREKQDEETRKKRNEIDEFESIARKQGDVTLRTLDYRSIIVSNEPFAISGKFENFADFVELLKKFHMSSLRMTEENLEKMLIGFVDYIDIALTEVSLLPIFDSFVEGLGDSFGYLANDRTLTLSAKFLDAYCVSKPQVWADLERAVTAKQTEIKRDQLIEILTHFGNQNEGSDLFYDTMEQRVIAEMPSLNISQTVNVMVAYFNRRVGRQEFMYNLLKQASAKLENEAEVVSLTDLRRLTLVLDDVLEIFEADQQKLYKLIEKHVLKQQEKLTFADACLFAKGFGFENGSKELFALLDAKTIDHLKEAQINDIRLYTEGFLYTYKISEKAFDVLDSKLTAFASNFVLFDIARIAKSYYMLGKESRPIFRQIEQRIIAEMYNSWQEIDKETIFEIVHCYSVTRSGSREFYRVLELMIVKRLNELAKDGEYIKGLIAMYEESGLCSAELLTRMRGFA